MRIAVTGAAGFIGRELVSRAREHGHHVAEVSRTRMPALDYEDAQALARLFDGCDVVVHLAARAHVRGSDADFECNVSATRAVAQAAQSAGLRRIVLLSSIGVNGNMTHDRPFTETDTPAPVEAYARSKLRAEQELQAGALERVIVRPPLVYGANAPGNFARLVHTVAHGWPLPLASVHNLRSLVGVRNLCELVVSCATHPDAADQLFLAADGDDLSTPEILRCVAQGLRKPARLWRVPVPLMRAGATLAGASRIAESLCESLQVDASKARRVLGWAPATNSPEGLVRAAAAWRFA